MALSPSTEFSPQLYGLITQSIIIPYKDDNTVIKGISKAHLYCLSQQPVYSHTVYIPDTNIPDSNIYLLDETYE